MNKLVQQDAVVVGAGFAGLYMMHRLGLAGLSAICFETAPDVGGTWYWNRYPGARCDAESIEYSYSFDPDLEQEWRWSERFATQPEIQRYAAHVAERFDLRRRIRFGTRVTAARFDADAGRWIVSTDQGDEIHARYVITAVGCLSTPKTPDIPGWQDFAGERYFTSSWPHDPIDFAGKRVGVIGTGSTGTQLIPLVAREAGHLSVFQRTPNFSVPARNAPISDEEDRRVKGDYGAVRAKARELGSAAIDGKDVSALAVSDEERLADFEACWQRGGPTLQAVFNDLMISQEANDTAAEFVRSKIRDIVSNPATAGKLLPAGFPLGAKRLCVDTGYYETFNRDNVSLVDVRAAPIVAVTPAGVRTTEREYPLDMLIFAMGFDAITGSLLAMDIRGRDGLQLKDAWKDGPHTYLGVATSGFPNLFIITGPGSPSVLSNVMVSIEQHVEWIDRLIGWMERDGIALAEVEPQAQAQWSEHVNAVADMTLFPKAASWYVGANVPGKPRMFLPYVGGVGNFRRTCDEIADAGYPGFAFVHSADARAQGSLERETG